jgi:hypothetical protein
MESDSDPTVCCIVLENGFNNEQRALTEQCPVSGHQNYVELVNEPAINTASSRVTLCDH